MCVTHFIVHSTVSTYFTVFLTCQFRGNEDSGQLDSLATLLMTKPRSHTYLNKIVIEIVHNCDIYKRKH